MQTIIVEDVYGNAATLNPKHIVMIEALPTPEQLRAQMEVEITSASESLPAEATEERMRDMQHQVATVLGLINAGAQAIVTTTSRLIYTKTEKGYLDQALSSALEG